MWIHWLFFKNLTKGQWPQDDLWPHFCWGHMCDSTQGSLCPSPMKIHQSVWITVTLFFKNLNQRSLIPRWPLTASLLKSHVWLYRRIIVSKSHGDTSMYVDTVINFARYHIHIYSFFRNKVQAWQKNKKQKQKTKKNKTKQNKNKKTNLTWPYKNIDLPISTPCQTGTSSRYHRHNSNGSTYTFAERVSIVQ